jgi:hypothetical protein
LSLKAVTESWLAVMGEIDGKKRDKLSDSSYVFPN